MRLSEVVAVALAEARDPERIAATFARKLAARAAEDRTLDRIVACPAYGDGMPGSPGDPDFALRLVRWIRACVDPSQDGRYTEWIVRVYANGGIPRAEDFGRVRQALDAFERGKRRLPAERRDINRIRTLRDLETLVGELGESERQAKRRARREIGGFDDPESWNWIHREAAYGIVVPRSHAESCAIAAYPRSHWCTAVRDDPGTFREYAKEGPLHIVVVPGRIRSADDIVELYQIHFESGQVMDADDTPAPLSELLRRFPALVPITARHFPSLRSLRPDRYIFALLDEGYVPLPDELRHHVESMIDRRDWHDLALLLTHAAEISFEEQGWENPLPSFCDRITAAFPAALRQADPGDYDIVVPAFVRVITGFCSDEGIPGPFAHAIVDLPRDRREHAFRVLGRYWGHGPLPVALEILYHALSEGHDPEHVASVLRELVAMYGFDEVEGTARDFGVDDLFDVLEDEGLSVRPGGKD